MIKAFKRINWYRLNRQLHRDVGYLCIGFALVFAISGIAVNHMADWNPNYAVAHSQLSVTPAPWLQLSDQQINQQLLTQAQLTAPVRSSVWLSPKRYQLFLEGGSNLILDTQNHQLAIEQIEPRPILQALNRLHLNETRNAWVYFSDMFAALLIFLALSALFMVKGKHGPKRPKSLLLISAGVVIPILFLLI
ncbi:PepSY-associated TM helix domain-containing protein [uncultured Ferrimonas sp.]|uniref:PepSY-associated TM helix domain-containing protein n=1 Tax=uncultured Ferrimonas sp. TaxID=432640 RepID=UPI0026174B7A|nr:PepSY-associated TM helix domain-containing protein [uncultured Ferrimonas sp.]